MRSYKNRVQFAEETKCRLIFIALPKVTLHSSFPPRLVSKPPLNPTEAIPPVLRTNAKRYGQFSGFLTFQNAYLRSENNKNT